jgi:hypothetical protein
MNARDFDPTLGRFIQQDPNPSGQYNDGMNLYQTEMSNPVIHVDPKGTKCRVAIRCGSVAGGAGVHCGIVVDTNVGPWPGYWGVDGTGGPVNQFAWKRNPPPWGRIQELTWTDYDDSFCKCLMTKTRIFNGMNVPRSTGSNNSNWAMHCLLRSCGADSIFEPLRPPVGWHCGKKCPI